MPETNELHYLEISEVARLLSSREVSAVELTQQMLRRIERVDPTLKSYALVTPDLALAQAKEADRMLGRRQILSQLHGVPIAVKDLCFTEGVTTASGMPLHRDFVPTIDATVVRRLREAGAVLLGKLQLTEGAFADHHPSIAPPVNPWHADHWSGASSSGSGVATAAGLCFGSLGLGHRRVDPISVGGQRQHRAQAHLGPRVAPRLFRTRRVARPHRADVPQRHRCGDHARRHRRRRRRRSHRAARAGARLPRR